MSALCGVCSQVPPKYKCPTCQLPYCSIPCFKSHKASQHSSNTIPDTAPIPESTVPASVQAAIPQAGDFSTLADHPSIQALFAAHPTLRDDLRRIFAATLAPDPSQQQQHHEQQNYRAHRGYRGRGRGRGQRGRGGGRDTAPWTPKRGENHALSMLRAVREGNWHGDSEGMREFVKLVGEIYGGANNPDNGAEEDVD